MVGHRWMVESSDVARVRYVQGRAEITIGSKTFDIERRDDEGRAHSCPIELVTAALGS